MSNDLEPSQPFPLVRYADWEDDHEISYGTWATLIRWRRQVPWWSNVALALSPGAFWVAIHFHSWSWIPLLFLISLGLFPAQPEVRDLVSDPFPEDHFPVSLHLRVHGINYGSDEGVVVFEAGWLIYMGRLCTFSVRSYDVGSIVKHPHQHKPSRLETTSADGLMLVIDNVTCLFEPQDTFKTSTTTRKGQAAIFNRMARQWISEPSPSGTPVFPPRSEHPAWRKHMLARDLAALLLPLMVLLSLLMKNAFSKPGWMSVVLLASAPAVFLLVRRLWVQVWLNRNREILKSNGTIES